MSDKQSKSKPGLPPTSPRAGGRKLPYRDIYAVGDTVQVSAIAKPRRRFRLPRIRFDRYRYLSASWLAILGFASIVVVGTLVLKLPIAAAAGVPITWSEAIFTSTSAVTVTGLVVLNTAEDFSRFGQITILLLLQIGGVGFVSLSVLLLRLIGRRITLQTRFLVQQSVGTGEWNRAGKLALYILAVTVAFEAVGALLLWLRWRTMLPDEDAAWLAIFHAVSSFCNAGFDLFAGTAAPTLFGFGADWFTLATMAALIILGGFGITVLFDLWASRTHFRWALNTRFTLLMALALSTIGFCLFLLDPFFRTLGGEEYSSVERTSVAAFTIISARTAGLTIVDLNSISEASQLIILLWMFIGGAPASMAGGVSTSTVAVLIFSVLAFARGHNTSVAFQRTLPAETIAKAVAIMTVGTILCASMTLILSMRLGLPIFATAFEVVSAFSNTGYSLGITNDLDTFSRYLIAFTMFWGRLGPITIVVALAQSAQPTLIRHPAEPVILG
ncbi:MAG: potassium transporter TrkG [Litorilinea sp.]